MTAVHFITGKGGTGKTTIAASLAVALAGIHDQVLLVEVEGRRALSRLFEGPELSYSEQPLFNSGTGQVFGLSIDPEAALVDYLEKFYNLGKAGAALKRIGAVDFATTIAPGLRDVLLTGKVSEIARSNRYSAIVVDAPPTGRIGRFLNVTAQVSDIAKIGPIRQHAELVKDVVQGADTHIHIVSTLEDMPIQETLDALDELSALGLQLGPIFVNRSLEDHIHPDDLDVLIDRDVDETSVAQLLKEAGLPENLPFPELAEALIDEATEFAHRSLLYRAQRQRLVDTKLPLIDLPLITVGIDRAGIVELASVIKKSWLP